MVVARPQPFVVKTRPPDVEETARRLGVPPSELREVKKLVDLVIAGTERLTLVAKRPRESREALIRRKRRPGSVKLRRKRRAASKKR